MIPFRKSIGFRLLAVSFILLALPLLLDFFILVEKQYERTIVDAKAYLVEAAHLRELPLSQIQPLNKSLIKVMVYLLGLDKNFPEKPSEELNEKLNNLAKLGDFEGASVLKITDDDRYLVIGATNSKWIGEDRSDFFKQNDLFSPEAIEQGYANYIFYQEKTRDPYIIIAHVIYSSEDEKPVGILAIFENIHEKLIELLAPDIHRYPVNFALLLPSTIVFAATDPQLTLQYFLPLKAKTYDLFIGKEPILKESLPTKPLHVDEKIGFPFFEFKWKDKKQIGYITRLSGSNFSLLTYASQKDIFQQPLITFFHKNGIYALTLLIGGTLAYFLIHRMAQPIQRLSLVMQGIQKGKRDLRYKKDPFGFEINALGNIFNETVDAVIEKKHLAEEERVKREKLAHELRLGQQMQRNLLPQKMPSYPNVELASVYIPAKEVGGDFYDVFVKNDKKLVLAIADAAGKGVQACFYSLSVRNMLRTYAKEYEDVGEAMLQANNLFTIDTAETGMFVTVLMGYYDYSTGILNYSSHGHNPVLVRRIDGKVERLHHLKIAMGVLSGAQKESHTIQLNKGDTLVFYTDGITDAHDETYLSFGENRLIECLQNVGGGSAAEVVEQIVAQVSAFAKKAPQHDDMTLLVMKVT